MWYSNLNNRNLITILSLFHLSIFFLFWFQDLKEALEYKENNTDELTELQEAVEMATLDKEMAEERVLQYT